MKKYSVSLIVPCYNIENITSDDISFENTMNSIINQSFGFENIELILVDNGSTDNTHNILKKYYDDYSNVFLYTIEENTGGPSTPRNLGIEKSTTDYVMFLDYDDNLNPKMIEILFDNITNNDVDLVKINYNVVIEGIPRKHRINKGRHLILSPKTSDIEYVSLYVWDAIYNKKFLNDNNIRFENLRGEDFLFMIDCITCTEKNIILLNDYEGINYNADNLNSVSHNCYTLDNLKSQINLCYKCLDKLTKSNIIKDGINTKTTFLKFTSMIFLFYTNEYNCKEEMFDILRKFLVDSKEYDFIKIYELSFTHYIFWKITNFFIIHNFKRVLFCILNLLKTIKKNERQ